MRDTGPDAAKNSIQSMLDKFLNDADSSAVAPVDTRAKAPKIGTEPGPVSQFVPDKKPARATN
jgi:hypothetical protein